MRVVYHITLPSNLTDDINKFLSFASLLLPSPLPDDLTVHAHPPSHLEIAFTIDHPSPIAAAQAILNAMKGESPT
jgi:hypothetical protein